MVNRDPNAATRAELRRLHEQATPRRWIATDNNGVVQIRSQHGLIAKLPARYGDAADASLIATARNSLPALLDETDAAHRWITRNAGCPMLGPICWKCHVLEERGSCRCEIAANE